MPPVVVTQPGVVQQQTWMVLPSAPAGCPPGLEYLSMVDQILCHQLIELLQVFTGWETNNRYVIKEVMRIHRPFVFCGGSCWCANCCGFEVVVEAPPGTVIGRVKQTVAACTLQFDVCDAADNAFLHIDGPCLMCRCCSDVEFPVLSKSNGQQVGCITKQWGGLVKEMFTNADNFGISFPMDLDVKMKGTLIGAVFLIDFMAFEQQKKNNRNY